MNRPNLRNSGSALLRKVVFDGYHFGLLLPFIANANRLFQQRDGFYIRRSDHPLHRYWRIPKTRLQDEGEELFQALVGLSEGAYSESWSSFSRKITDAQEAPKSDAFSWGLAYRIAPLTDGGVLLSGDYHPGVVAVAKRMRGAFLSATKAWRIPGSTEVIRSNLIQALGFSENQFEMIDALQALHSDGSVSTASDIASIKIGGPPIERDNKVASELGEADVYLAAVPSIYKTDLCVDDIDSALSGFSLMEHQPAGIKHLLQRSSALLADDMGLGKTRQAIIAAGIRAADRPILVVVLASLVINWTREIQAVYPQATTAQQAYDPSAQWMIVNYERLGDYVSLASKFTVMIVDEAHRLKEPTAAWTRHGFDIAAQVANRYLLTGTPVLNREAELHTLLRLSGHPIGELPLKSFCERFAGNSAFRESLRAEIGDWMLRRSKDALPGLKGKRRQVLPVVLSDEERKRYNAVRDSERPPFARLGALRQLLETAKIATAMRLLADLDADDKVIMFCEYKDTVRALKELCEQAGIGCVTLIGSDSIHKRQKALDMFHGIADVRVFIGTTSAAGTGNNITAANYVFFLGLPWTPGMQDQAEDRAYRNGQLRMVIVKIPLAEDTIDQDLWRMLQGKRQLASELIEGAEGARRMQDQLASMLDTEKAASSTGNILYAQ